MTAYDEDARLEAWEDLRPIADGGSGQAFTLSHPTPGTTDPATDIITPGTPVVQTGCGIVEAYKAYQIDGTIIRAGDQRIMLAALDVTGQVVLTTPEIDDTVLIGAKSWTVKNVEAFEPAGLTIFSYLQVRGA